MSIAPFLKLLRSGQLLPALRANAFFKPFYTLTWIATAKEIGLIDRLTAAPVPFDTLAAPYGSGPKSREAFEAWLQLGVRLKLLTRGADGYALKGLARTLSLPRNDGTLALIQEAASLHHRLIARTPAKLARGQLWDLGDQDAGLTARSSRALEPFQLYAIDRAFPRTGPRRLLEIGCGAGACIRHAAQRNPALTAVGLELQPEVAALARRNVDRWGLDSRVVIEDGDIRARTPSRDFDIATLHNNIYYFPVDERVRVLDHVRQFLRPGGKLLLTTCCQGGSPGIEVLNLWGAATANAGRLPAVGEMQQQLHQAHFTVVRTMRLIPNDSYYAVVATSGTGA
jgi:SAM-dependent methyltransferase